MDKHFYTLIVKTLFGVLGVAAPLLFPSLFAVAVVVVSALFVPSIALFAGMLTDALYYLPGHYFFPYATLIGLAISIMATFVQSFRKARIIG